MRWVTSGIFNESIIFSRGPSDKVPCLWKQASNVPVFQGRITFRKRGCDLVYTLSD